MAPLPDDRRPALSSQHREHNRHSGSHSTDLFMAPPGAPEPPAVLLFHHIPKTAGTSLRNFIQANLAGHEHVWDVPRVSRDRAALLEWYRVALHGLSDDRRARLACVMSHSANFMLPALEGPVHAVTMLRDPVDRVGSQWAVRSDRARRKAERKRSEAARTLREGSLAELYERLGGGTPRDSELPPRFASFFNGQSRSLLRPHYDLDDLPYSAGPPPDADRWRERLFEDVAPRYEIGLREDFEAFVQRLAARYGWRVLLPRAKVNAHRGARPEPDAGTVTAIEAHNWLDLELYARCTASSPAASAAP